MEGEFVKKFYYGILLYISGLLCGFSLLLITIFREVETYVKFSLTFFFLISLAGLIVCTYECYQRNKK